VEAGETATLAQSADGNGAEPSGTTPALRADPPRKGEGEEEAEEPKPILLWRPARFEQRPRHHRQDNRQRRGQRDGAIAADGGKAQGDRTQRDGDRPQRSDARPPRENGGNERFERGKFKGKPSGDGQRPDRRDNRPGDKGGFQGKQPFQARPPREERPVRVDPDSPFAKLAALRDQLKK
jgi:ATP-dependent RNA helicase SUPV3L1/SUV3